MLKIRNVAKLSRQSLIERISVNSKAVLVVDGCLFPTLDAPTRTTFKVTSYDR